MGRLNSSAVSSPSPQSTVGSTKATHQPRKATVSEYVTLWQKLAAKRPPQSFLDERFRKPKANPSCPTLHFGLGFSADNVEYCAHQHQLLPPGKEEEIDDPNAIGHRMSIGVMAVKHHLEVKLGVRLFFEIPFGTENLGVYALYTNYTRRRLRRPKTENSILVAMRQELNLDPKQMAKWYWDDKHGVGYRCQYPEFNLSKRKSVIVTL
ncbi:hypothetical protein PENSPDRAFT_645723 [Peniophora sp. CONT]|nr:hypothetical protein PENSPDRAFT_645723 [Peniophora sp. CONT]